MQLVLGLAVGLGQVSGDQLVGLLGWLDFRDSFHTVVLAGSCRSGLSAPGQTLEQVLAVLSFHLLLLPGAALVVGGWGGTGQAGEATGVNKGLSSIWVTQEGSPGPGSPLSPQGMGHASLGGV